MPLIYFASQDGSIATVAMTYMYMHTLYTNFFTRLHVNFAPKAYMYAKLSIACSTELQATENWSGAHAWEQGYYRLSLTVPLFLPSPHTGAPANADKDVDSKVLLVFGADRGWIVAHVLPQVAPSVSKAGILRGRRTVPMGSLLEQF